MNFNFSNFPILNSERLLLRKATLNDKQTIFDLRSCKEINKFVGTKRIETLDEAESFIKDCIKLFSKKKRVFWLIEYNEEVLGSIVLHKISLKENYAEIGYKLKPEFHKQGYMNEALKLVLEFGFHKLKLKTIEAFTHKNNIASTALLSKHNFIFQPDRKCATFEFNRIWKLEEI